MASLAISGARAQPVYDHIGLASWYGAREGGHRTASGAVFDPAKFSAAHRKLPLGSCVRVTRLANHQSIIVPIIDRGPFVRGRLLDLSWAAAERLGMIAQAAKVRWIARVACAAFLCTSNRVVTKGPLPMKSLANRAPANLDRHSNVGADYDRAGERYRAYADGDLDTLYNFDGQYGFSDRETWGLIGQALHELRMKGVRRLSVVDLGCGPGTRLRRIIDRARQMGFTKIMARGFDLAEAQVRRARLLSHNLASHSDVDLRFEVGDIRSRMPEADGSVDICLCLYGVLNHLPAEDLPALFREVARVTKGQFFTTIRAIGSTPTVYVDGVKAAKAYHQDNVRGRLDVEFQDGSRTIVPIASVTVRRKSAPWRRRRS